MRWWIVALGVFFTACQPADRDGDGWGDDVDCDDEDPEVHPDADERCDGIDNDCDGTIDGPTSIDALVWYIDADRDGAGNGALFAKACEQPTGWVANGSDCADDNAARHPGAAEIPGNGIDEDCSPAGGD